MAIDAELEGIVQLVNSAEQAPPGEQDVADLRAAFAGLITMFGPGDERVEVHHEQVPGPSGEVPVRRYRAVGAPGGPLPTLVWFHGGGWVIGDLDTHDPFCRDVAAASGLQVLSVGYRLAPEHRFPAAHDDCLAVVEWLLGEGADLEVDADRLVLGGDSAGGHLATVTARRRRDRADSNPGPVVAGQVLVYPVTDLSASAGEHPSRVDNGEGYLLTAETMDFFTDSYVPDPGQRSTADASPLRCADLAGLPPALVLVAELDPLRDEGVAYAHLLEQHGVRTTLTHLDGAVHLCAQLRGTRLGGEVVQQIADFVRATTA